MTDVRTKEQIAEPDHLYQLWGEKDEDFFARIDRYGGWPIGMKYVSFFHDGPVSTIPGRKCEFGNQYLRTGWWTTIAEADDYYRWKLSPKAITEIKLEGRKEAIRALGGVAI